MFYGYSLSVRLSGIIALAKASLPTGQTKKDD